MEVMFCLRWAYPEAMAKAGFYHQVSLRCHWTPTIWTPTWYKQFCFPLKKKSSYILSYINPPNTDTGSMDTWYKHFHFLNKKLNILSYISLFNTDTEIWIKDALLWPKWHDPYKVNLAYWIWLSNHCKFWFCTIMCQLYLLRKWKLSTALLLFWFVQRIIC